MSEIAKRSENRCPPGWCRSQQIAHLRTTLAEAERERDNKSVQIAELQEQLHHLFGIEQARDKAETALAEACEIIEPLLDCYNGNSEQLVYYTRAFLKRTK